METFVIDTHALIWFLTGNKNLSEKSREILLKSQSEKACILISSIVLAEILYILKKRNIKLDINELLNLISKSSAYKIVPFDLPVFTEMLKLPNNLEMHDRIIAATSKYYNSKLISKDKKLNNLKGLNIVW